MKKNIIIAILAILVAGMGGYLVYNNVLLEENKEVPNTKEENATNLTKYDSNVLDISKLSDYILEGFTKEDLENGTLKSVDSHPYYINLTLNGKINVCNINKCNYLTNTEKVIDIVKFLAPGAEPSEQQIYVLLDNGDVYNYKFGNIDNNVFEAEKVENVNNVERIINYHYTSEEHSGGATGIIAITKDNNYIQISQYKTM